MVKFGDTTLPHVLTIKQQDSTILQEIPLPYRRTAYRKWLGGKGLMFNIGGYMKPTDDITPSILRSLADGVPRALDLESTELVRLESAQRYQTGPPVVWTDNTAEAKTPGGTPFTLLGATSDYYYFGHAEKWNQISFDLDTLGVYGVTLWEYSRGNGQWATLNIENLIDHFPGSELDDTIWNQTRGPAITVADSIATLNASSDEIDVNTYGTYPPGYRTTIIRAKMNETTENHFIYPVWFDDNNNIRLSFESNGNCYFEGAGAGSYDTSWHTYVIVWMPTKLLLYRDGLLIATYNDPNMTYIPQGGNAGVKLQVYLNGRMDIDYVYGSLNDPTRFFSQDGSITLTPPSDWAIDTVNAITNKFWLRCSVPAVTTAATVNEIWLQQIYNCLMLDPQFTLNAENYKRTDYSLSFAQQENP